MAKTNKPVPPAPAAAERIQPAEKIAPFWGQTWLPGLTLVAVACAVYALSVKNGFVFFDDDKAILPPTPDRSDQVRALIADAEILTAAGCRKARPYYLVDYYFIPF